ncbi:hypothetical protein [Alloprevotella sp. oral taxon 473]|jgi:hypothetical protein|uniref:hypothetical protein n=1 Tax=Alloprevotella sp. oral taxon 473 TaxID=712469 RepID=UPI0002A37FBB|nr:hypothetical protein [Alloprevotella sp. oral taxon 473]EKX88353.1 hypothetical protein HMPREF9999_01898 [Alloprevotella sp. oral taxon 473 str. F0040]
MYYLCNIQIKQSQYVTQRTETTRSLTTEEAELIKAIRHYKAAYPNGAKSLLRYAQELFDNLIVQQ